MSRYKPYPEYKESGVAWFSTIPDHWHVSALKYWTIIKTGYAFSSNDFQEAGIPVLRIGDIKNNGDIDFSSAKFLSDSFLFTNHDVIVKYNDIVMAMTGATIGKTGKYTLSTPALLNQRVCIFRAINTNSQPYLWYTLQSSFYLEYINLYAFGGAQPNISDSTLLSFPTPLPPLSEQTTIANFLDRETAKIDTLIGKQERLIELLQEKRQALISHAVTKGLDPNVKMKESGVEWLGEVPEHSEVVKLGYLTSKIGSGKTPKGGAEVYSDTGILFLRSQNVYDDGLHLDDVVKISELIHAEMENTHIKSGDILLNVTGGSIGRSCLVPDDIDRANVNQHVCIIRLIKKEYQAYISFAMKSSVIKAQIDSVQNGAAREGLNFEQISGFKIAIAPPQEQNLIVDYIKDKTTKIDILITKTTKAIALLKERRTALISAAVTGKIKVNDEVREDALGYDVREAAV